MTEKPKPPAVTRFAPSPTGLLHLGHAFSALYAEASAKRDKGRFLLRIEDIDKGRCRSEFEDALLEDLAWLGLDWEEPVRRQSDHMADYEAALRKLIGFKLLYPCFCTRKDIQAEIEQIGHAPHGPDGPVYPGTCKRLDEVERAQKMESGVPFALRLDVEKALVETGPLHWTDRKRGKVEATPCIFGDVVLARKDTPTSYHLSVTLDDDLQDISLVTRGQDLFEATHIHRLLQELLGLKVPDYDHHPLMTGEDGKRYAKRDQSKTLKSLRETGHSPAEVRKMAGF